MRSADHIDSAGGGHGLLGAKAQWHLPLGVAHAKPWLWAARASILLMSALFLAWAGALMVQAFSRQGGLPWLGLGAMTVAGLPWLCTVSRLWQGLARRALVPLRWGGLAPHRVTSRSKEAPRPGWSVPGWPHPVSLRVVFDLGPWLLVKMVSVGRGPHPQAWFWVDARVSLQGVSGHHLRALLFSTRANEVGLEQASAADEGTMMASSGNIQRQWSNLLSSFKIIGQDAGSGANQPEAGARGVAMFDSDFAQTVILEFPQRPSLGRDALPKAVRGGRS